MVHIPSTNDVVHMVRPPKPGHARGASLGSGISYTPPDPSLLSRSADSALREPDSLSAPEDIFSPGTSATHMASDHVNNQPLATPPPAPSPAAPSPPPDSHHHFFHHSDDKKKSHQAHSEQIEDMPSYHAQHPTGVPGTEHTLPTSSPPQGKQQITSTPSPPLTQPPSASSFKKTLQQLHQQFLSPSHNAASHQQQQQLTAEKTSKGLSAPKYSSLTVPPAPSASPTALSPKQPDTSLHPTLGELQLVIQPNNLLQLQQPDKLTTPPPPGLGKTQPSPRHAGLTPLIKKTTQPSALPQGPKVTQLQQQPQPQQPKSLPKNLSSTSLEKGPGGSGKHERIPPPREDELRTLETTKRGLLPSRFSFIEYMGFRILMTNAPSPEELPSYADLLQRFNVKHLLRVCESTYDAKLLQQKVPGLQFYDMPFPDGTVPPDHVVNAWLDILELTFGPMWEAQQKNKALEVAGPESAAALASVKPSSEQKMTDINSKPAMLKASMSANGLANSSSALVPSALTAAGNIPPTGNGGLPVAVAVHCMAGLGRSPLLVAIALVELGMDPIDSVGFIRAYRRGAINARQVLYLEEYKRRPPPQPRRHSSTTSKKAMASVASGNGLFKSLKKKNSRPTTPAEP